MRHDKSAKRNRAANTDQPEDPKNLSELNSQLSGYAYTPEGGTRHFSEDDPTPPRRSRWKKVLLGFLLLFIIAGGWFGWKIIGNEVKVFGWKGIWSILKPTKLQGEDRGYVNILLAGNSADDPGHAGAQLTDSIMLVSVNTKSNKAFMVSVPRDLYVDIPGSGYAKINEAYQIGERENFNEGGFAPGGMGLLQKIVSERFGLPIDYYALVDYAAVKGAVDAVGGITIDIKSEDSRGLYDPSPDLASGRKVLVDLPNGPQKLNGAEALGLARARGSAPGSYGFLRSDFDRTEHQRQILLAVKEKATSAGTLANPLKVAGLADSFGNNVRTDLTLGEVRRLYDLSKKIPAASVVSVGLNDWPVPAAALPAHTASCAVTLTAPSTSGKSC